MTEASKDQLTSVAISIRVDNKPSFMLLLTEGGDVKRMGYSVVNNEERTVAVGHDPSHFQRFIAALREDVLSHAGTHEDDGYEGDRVVCRIELAGGPEPVTFEMTYYSLSASLPRPMASIVDLAEALTDEWYSGHLTPSEDGSAATRGDRPVTLVPPPTEISSQRADWIADDTPAGADVVTDDASNEDTEPGPMVESGGAADSGSDSNVGTDPGLEVDPNGKADSGKKASEEVVIPKASPQRIVLAVALDFVVMASLYLIVRAPFVAEGAERSGPPGAPLVIFVLLEFCLLWFVRRSLGYWMLGMSMALGDVPRVDPRQLAGESIFTHIAGVVFLLTGAAGVMAWIGGHTPFPFFGIGFGAGPSIVLTFLLGVVAVVAGVLFFRNDVRAVWVGAGCTGFLLVAVLFARGDLLWYTANLFVDHEGRGRPPSVSFLDGWWPSLPLLIQVAPLAYGAGLYGVWRDFEKRVRRPEPEPVAEATP